MAGLNVQGIAHPFRFGPHGHPNRNKGAKRIGQNLKGVALTAKGERIRERATGTIGYKAVLRNMTSGRMGLVAAVSEMAMNEQEPRANTYNVTLEKRDRLDGHAIMLIVPWQLRDDEGHEDVAEAQIQT